MANKTKSKSVAALEREVKHHNYLYFVERRPEISDYDFDLLVEELKKLKPDSKVLAEIGSDLTEVSEKVVHKIPMLSLDKAYDQKNMDNWASKFSGDIIVSPKIDGCAVSIKYDDKGNLSVAATRGNGIEGELITGNALEIKDIPAHVKDRGIEVRGEVYMPLSVFKKYSKEFANPRNLAGGAIKQKDFKKTAEYNLSFWAYDLQGTSAKTEKEKMIILKQNGFLAIEWSLIKPNDIQTAFDNLFDRRDEFDFETDGVVYKVNDVSEQARLGATAHHPRHAIAYKFQGDSDKTTLIDVEWQVARTGVITPVGVVEPVTLSGATVTRASLHNYGLMKKLGLTKGAEVLMMRRGGVIPNLESVVKAGKGSFSPPIKCPSCGSDVELKDDFLYCTNVEGCMHMNIAGLEHFIKTIDCDGFGVKLIEQLYDTQLVAAAADFYRLKKSEILNLERMGETLAEKLVRNINAKRELTLETFLRALGIKELGRHAARILAENYGSLENVFKAEKEELANIHSIGEVIAGHVVDGLKQKKGLIKKLLTEVRVLEHKKVTAHGPLAGKKVLFTATLSTMDRKAAQSLVEEKGGVAVAAISKEVDYLVVGSLGKAGSKLGKAEELAGQGSSIKIMNEKDFFKMLKK